MSGFEYLRYNDSPEVAQLNALGKQGWFVAAVLEPWKPDNYPELLLSRPIQEHTSSVPDEWNRTDMRAEMKRIRDNVKRWRLVMPSPEAWGRFLADQEATLDALARADSVIRAQAVDLEEARELLKQRKTEAEEAERLLNAVRIAANVDITDSDALVGAVGALRNELVDTRAELGGQRERVAGLEHLTGRIVEGLKGDVRAAEAEVERLRICIADRESQSHSRELLWRNFWHRICTAAGISATLGFDETAAAIEQELGALRDGDHRDERDKLRAEVEQNKIWLADLAKRADAAEQARLATERELQDLQARFDALCPPASEANPVSPPFRNPGSPLYKAGFGDGHNAAQSEADRRATTGRLDAFRAGWEAHQKRALVPRHPDLPDACADYLRSLEGQ